MVRKGSSVRVPSSALLGPTPVHELEIRGDMIRLGQLLKLSGLADSGAEAKALLLENGVTVNGEPESASRSPAAPRRHGRGRGRNSARHLSAAGQGLGLRHQAITSRPRRSASQLARAVGNGRSVGGPCAIWTLMDRARLDRPCRGARPLPRRSVRGPPRGLAGRPPGGGRVGRRRAVGEVRPARGPAGGRGPARASRRSPVARRSPAPSTWPPSAAPSRSPATSTGPRSSPASALPLASSAPSAGRPHSAVPSARAPASR